MVKNLSCRFELKKIILMSLYGHKVDCEDRLSARAQSVAV